MRTKTKYGYVRIRGFRRPGGYFPRILAVVIILQSVFTRYEFGFVKVIPFRAHLMLDCFIALFTLVSTCFFGFVDVENARNSILGIASWRFSS